MSEAFKPTKVPNPWGLSALQASALDVYLQLGDHQSVAELMGRSKATVANLISYGLAKIPGQHRLHRLMVWRDFRKALPSPAFRPVEIIPFGVTPRQARMMDLFYENGSCELTAQAIGSSPTNVSEIVRRGERSVPGATRGEKRANWIKERRLQASQK